MVLFSYFNARTENTVSTVALDIKRSNFDNECKIYEDNATVSLVA